MKHHKILLKGKRENIGYETFIIHKLKYISLLMDISTVKISCCLLNNSHIGNMNTFKRK